MKFETFGEHLSAPEPLDRTIPDDEYLVRRRAWGHVLREAIRAEDAWGVLVTASNGDVTLCDVSHDGVWRATDIGGEARLVRATPGWDSPES